MAYQLGLNCKLFRGNVGATAATEVKNVKDVSLNMEGGEADVTTRKSEGWKATMRTLKEATIEFQMLYDPSDSDVSALFAAYNDGIAIAIKVGDANGTGLDCDAVISSFNMEQNLEEAVTATITIKPTIVGASGRAPSWG